MDFIVQYFLAVFSAPAFSGILLIRQFLISPSIDPFGDKNKDLKLYFLDVGQGDSELVILPAGPKILIDGGPNNQVINKLDSILKSTDRYIDLVILSHVQIDHFNGLIDVLKRYQIGAFIFNGQKGEASSFKDLEKTLQENKTKIIVLVEGDKIKYQNNYFAILSPSKKLLSTNDPNETALVMELISQGSKILFTGDISSKIEKYLLQKYDLDIDVLKVSHHGSKYSSSKEFLDATTPKISVIEVGKNSYGHPTEAVLNKLIEVGSQIFRTDKDGMIKLIIDNSNISLFKKKQGFGVP